MSTTTTTSTITEAVIPLLSAYKQWNVGANGSGPVLSKTSFERPPDRNYSLSNRVVPRFLQYAGQDVGINLGWTDDASAATGRNVSRWFFAVRDLSLRPVNYGETIALAHGKGDSFLKYSVRTWGINLSWSRDPVFEWQLLGGRRGQPVQQDRYLAIYNRKVKRFLVYFDRNVGGDIGWDDSMRWEDQIGGVLEDLVKEFGDDAVRVAVMAALAA